MQNNWNFNFFTKKRADFQAFFDFLQPLFGQGRLGHLQSLEYSSNPRINKYVLKRKIMEFEALKMFHTPRFSVLDINLVNLVSG